MRKTKKIKNLALVLLLCMCLFILSGCEEKTATMGGETVSISDLEVYLPIPNTTDLVYNKTTHIVYIENFTYAGNYVYTPYYASNGTPYRYNIETGVLEATEGVKSTTCTCEGCTLGK